MVWLIFIRRALTFVLLTRFFQFFTLSPRLLHPDRANGCSPVGEYPLRFSFFVLVAGCWVFLVIVYPEFFGGQINLKYDTAFYALLYVILTIVGFFTPIWHAHTLMRQAKDRALEQIAREIDRLLRQINTTFLNVSFSLPTPLMPTNTKDLIDLIETLRREYKIIDEESKTWPFNLTSLNQFLLSFGIPLLSTVISVVLALLGK